MTYTKEIKREVKLLILTYGYLPFLYLIAEYEESQDFEACKLLFECIKEFSEYFDLDLPTKYSENAAETMLLEFERQGMTGETALLNTAYYAAEIRDKVLELTL